jgi:hypothetical protein
MKKTILSLTLVTTLLAACNSNNNTQTATNTEKRDTTTATSELQAPASTQASPVSGVITAYLQMKNALTGDNSQEAATAGKQLNEAIQLVQESSLTTDQKKVYVDVKDDMKEHSEHISTNGGNIEHQREHFDMLSKDLYDLVKVAPPAQPLYQTHCPMYNKGKGANWLSEVKEIKNPYLGKKMPTCGTVEEEIK